MSDNSNDADGQYDDDDYEDDFGSEGECSSKDDDGDTNTCTSRAPPDEDKDSACDASCTTEGDHDLQWPLVDAAPTLQAKGRIGNASEPTSSTSDVPIESKESLPSPSPSPSPSPAPAPAPASPAPSTTTTATATRTTTSPPPSIQQRLIDTSDRLVKSEEKNLALGLRLERANEELARIKAEVLAYSQALLSGLGVADAIDKYQNVPLAELLRLRLQESSCSSSSSSSPSVSSSTENRPLCNTSNTSTSQHQHHQHHQQHDISSTQKLERRLATEKQRSRNLEKRVAELQAQLDGANVEAGNETDDLKLKVSKLADRARTERELRARAEKDLAKSKEQTEVLSEHIETLMMQIKQQASAKSQALKDLSSASREVDLLKSRSAAMSKRNTRKDALINDLRNEAAALESELQSMQEKYGELRLKVDWTRSQTTNTLKKKNEEIQHLQTKLEFLARKDRVLEGMNSSYEQKSKVINTHTGRKTVAIRRGVGFRGYSP